MVKFISKIKGSQIILFQERARLGTVTDVLIDPKDGSFVGLSVEVPGDGMRYIPTSEIKGYGTGMVMINDLGSLSAADDVIRIKKVLPEKPEIVGARVYTEEGAYIGKVNDATINVELNALERLYIGGRTLFDIFSSDRIIAAKNIVRIEKKKIVIAGSGAKKVLSESLQAKAEPSE
ncbi:MAG: PRC-barrel domain-containing protein [Patescibacteria group bacterium]|nr:PRC-barrel domain-containing protein [Patescibacteria group bacterium]